MIARNLAEALACSWATRAWLCERALSVVWWKWLQPCRASFCCSGDGPRGSGDDARNCVADFEKACRMVSSLLTSLVRCAVVWCLRALGDWANLRFATSRCFGSDSDSSLSLGISESSSPWLKMEILAVSEADSLLLLLALEMPRRLAYSALNSSTVRGLCSHARSPLLSGTGKLAKEGVLLNKPPSSCPKVVTKSPSCAGKCAREGEDRAAACASFLRLTKAATGERTPRRTSLPIAAFVP